MPFNIIKLLTIFRPLFSYRATFLWFVVVILGFLLRFDHYGVSSFVRWLSLPANSYPLIIHFFHTASWSLGEVMMVWMKFCIENFSLVIVNERLVVVGDGIKVPKESNCQPGTKYLHSPSQNQNKPQKFVGHSFGAISFIAQAGNYYRAILQTAQIHEGVDHLRQLEKPDSKKQTQETSVSRMISLIIICVIHQGTPAYAVLDAFFSTSVAFKHVFNRVQENGAPWVHLITRAKSSYVAYPSGVKSKKEGIKLWKIFDNTALFTEKEHPLHPNRKIKYYTSTSSVHRFRDLYWGADLFYIRFVWVIDNGKKFILMSSDITLCPLSILKMYGLRFEIELSFRSLKNLIGGFGYRFWSLACEKINGKNILVDLDTQNTINEKSLLKLSAIERDVNLAIIAQGILSYFALVKTQWVWSIHHASSWLRSYTSPIPSEEVVQRAFQCYYIASFSLSELKSWLNPKHLSMLPKEEVKVRKNPTFEQFLLT